MVSGKSLVIYKNRPALVLNCGDKIEISPLGGETLRVREKDIEALHPGPVGDFAALEQDVPAGDVRGAWELLEGSVVPLRELAELVYGTFSPKTAWAAYNLLRDGLYFTGTMEALSPRDASAVAAEEQKRAGKERDLRERDAFLTRLKNRQLELPGDSRFLQDVEALAWGKTEKSRTLKDLGLPETPQEAHGLLLEAQVWTPLVNPYPSRFGLSLSSAKIPLDLPPAEDRLDLSGLPAYAIDNAWSGDPDDAVSLEGPDSRGNHTLWVHVADPAAALLPGSPAELEARGRGATLYLPECTCRMLAEESLADYALGLGELSPALSFKLLLNNEGSILETGIFPSKVRVTRMTYEEADAHAGDKPDLTGLFQAAERNLARRLAAGAVSIELPEVHITLSQGELSISPISSCRSADMVRECMLLAGEGAAQWALQRRLPFPYVSQEVGDLPAAPLPGMAGSYQLRRCMRPRSLSTKPGLHGGLGLSCYTQVTSPLRRYTDLLAHQQIRAFLQTGAWQGRKPLDEDEVLMRLAAAEAAASAASQAERASRAHWTAVYLSDKKGSDWDGIVMEKKGSRVVVMIPALALETQSAAQGDLEPNEPVQLTLGPVKIPGAETSFSIR
jgi:exoribonuclease-2